MRKTPREELQRRTKALQGRMASDGIDGTLILQNADLFYFAGTVHPSYLFIPATGDPILMVRKNLGRVREESEMESVCSINSPRDLPGILAEKGYARHGRLGMELDVLPVNVYRRFCNALDPGEIADISPAVQAVRAVKSRYEIGIMKEAAALCDFMVGVARTSLREGMREVELAGAIESAARARGHQGMVRMRSFNQEIYWGYLVSGPDSAEPSFIDTTTGGRGVSIAFPSGAGLRGIGRHEPVLFDLVGVADGYNSDQTRTLSLGSLPDRLDKAYKVSLEILHALEEMVGPGVSAEDFYLKAETIAADFGLGDHFMGCGGRRPAFCGHGIGIELDELPVLMKGNRTPLAPGMVFTLEPKFIFPGLGAVGVEDNFTVTERGAEKLTNSTYDVEV